LLLAGRGTRVAFRTVAFAHEGPGPGHRRDRGRSAGPADRPSRRRPSTSKVWQSYSGGLSGRWHEWVVARWVAAVAGPWPLSNLGVVCLDAGGPDARSAVQRRARVVFAAGGDHEVAVRARG